MHAALRALHLLAMRFAVVVASDFEALEPDRIVELERAKRARRRRMRIVGEARTREGVR
jgi:hypothetical protein